MLITHNKYRIGSTPYTVEIEPADECCLNVCDVKNCTCNKEFQEFLKACNATMCVQILGIGRYFKKVQDDEKEQNIVTNFQGENIRNKEGQKCDN